MNMYQRLRALLIYYLSRKNDVIPPALLGISPSLLSDLCIYLTDGMLFLLFFSFLRWTALIT